MIRAPCPPDDMVHGRILPDIDVLMEIQAARDSNLIRVEVLAITLYTGPLVRIITRLIRIYSFCALFMWPTF